MKTRLLEAANNGLVFAMVAAFAAEAAEVRVLASYGARDVIQEIAPRFEAATGHKLAIDIQTPRAIRKTIQHGATADVVIVAGVDFAKGNVVPASVTPVARGVLVAAVRKDAQKPDMSSADAVKRALLAAKSISYSASSPPLPVSSRCSIGPSPMRRNARSSSAARLRAGSKIWLQAARPRSACTYSRSLWPFPV